METCHAAASPGNVTRLRWKSDTPLLETSHAAAWNVTSRRWKRDPPPLET